MREDILAVDLVAQRELERVGPGFVRAFPLPDGSMFEDMLLAIDRADEACRKRQEGGSERQP